LANNVIGGANINQQQIHTACVTLHQDMDRNGLNWQCSVPGKLSPFHRDTRAKLSVYQ